VRATIVGSCLFVALLWTSGPAAAQVHPRATATIAAKPGAPTVIVTLTNRADVLLEAWQVRITDAEGTPVDFTVDAATDTAPQGTPDRGPLSPGETRRYSYTLGAVPHDATVSLHLLMFSDNTYDGAADERSVVLLQRERLAQELNVLLDALTSAPDGAPLHVRRDICRSLFSDPRLTSGMARTYRDQVTAALDEPDRRAFAALTAKLTAAMTTMRERLLSHQR
jgi:hypothetical protein